MPWKTKTGQMLHVKDITTPHLVNIAKLLSRMLSSKVANTASFYLNTPGPNGEMAQDLFEEEQDFWFSGGNEYMTTMDAALDSLLSDRPDLRDVVVEMDKRQIMLTTGNIVPVSYFLGL
jgi:hypothetical protein